MRISQGWECSRAAVTCLTTEVQTCPWKQITPEESVDSRHSVDSTSQPQRESANSSGQALALCWGSGCLMLPSPCCSPALSSPLCPSTRALRIAPREAYLHKHKGTNPSSWLAGHSTALKH